MMKIKIANILMLFATIGIFCSPSLQAQEDQLATSIVKAKILDEGGKPIPQVLVKSFFANDKAITDLEGNFSIKVDTRKDQLMIATVDYETNSIQVVDGGIDKKDIVLIRKGFMGNRVTELPYQTLSNDRTVSSVYTVTGDELTSFPSSSFVEALSGRIPGLVITTYTNNPVQESVTAYLRGEWAVFYIDGIQRDPSDLTVFEVETVQVIKDLSGRSALGLSGTSPVIWIKTKSGKKFQRELSVSAESGFNSATRLPDFVDSYTNAMLYNEALKNDGLQPYYSSTDLAKYKDGSDPLYHPNIDYYKRYVTQATPFRRANVNFRGGDDAINYFSLIDLMQSEGLEAIGENSKYSRFKLRGGVNIKLNDVIQFKINLSGTYGKSKYPNEGSSAQQFNIFNYISRYPSNAHAISFQDKYIVSTEFPLNLDNELKNTGYANGVNLNSQNNVSLLLDLKSILKGLTFNGTAAFDLYNSVVTSKGGTAALYRLLPNEQLTEVQQKVVQPNLARTGDYFTRGTTTFMTLNYDRTFGLHQLTMSASYFNGITDYRGTGANYQSDKRQDLSYRLNYAYDGKYVLQVDLPYSGTIKMPKGDRFNLYHSIGAGWVASKESFLSSSSVVDYLKFYGSFGVMGNSNFSTSYNPYYLYKTLWQANGSWTPGINGNVGESAVIYQIQQQGSSNFHLPQKQYLNLGVQSQLFKKALSLEANYFSEKDYDFISVKSSFTPSIFGTDGFLPVTNFGSVKKWGLEGAIQYENKIGDLKYSFGGNVLYSKSKNVEVDEPIALDAYRKRAGTYSDAIWLYESEGLYRSQQEITSRGVTQSWGSVQPGDIRYRDYNDDGVVDEKDVINTGKHAPRVFYGVNLRLKYKGLGLYVLGQGQADGHVYIGNSYFNVVGNNQNYSTLMLDRYNESNTDGSLPRMTTQSQNNTQGSTFWLRNAASFGIKNIELSFDMPKHLGSSLFFPDLTFYLRAKNVISFSELSKYGLEIQNPNASNYPVFRTVTFGVSCKF